jgi:S-adenosylmethionine/arginine decarboxylase-like enzyme
MKAVMIVYNKAVSEQVMYILEKLNIDAYTKWETVYGKGIEGEPRMGTHTWPEENTAIISVMEENKLEPLKQALSFLDNANKEVGIRAFVWEANYLF